jgi:hypothetical protein
MWFNIRSSNLNTVCPNILSPRQVLFGFYEASNHADRMNGDNWCSDLPYYTYRHWYGVSTKGSDVVELDLSSNGLIDRLPVTLKTLNLYNNSLSGSVPSALGLIVALSHLRLSRTYFSGTIPSSFGSLVMIQYLQLDENKYLADFSVLLPLLTI